MGETQTVIVINLAGHVDLADQTGAVIMSVTRDQLTDMVHRDNWLEGDRVTIRDWENGQDYQLGYRKRTIEEEMATWRKYEVSATSAEDFLDRYYKHDRFRGIGEEYAQILIESYAAALLRNGFTIISHHDSKTGEVVAVFQDSINKRIS